MGRDFEKILKDFGPSEREKKRIEKEFFSEELIYDNEKKKGYCSKCGHEFNGKFKEKKFKKCPKCKSWEMTKSKGRSRIFQLKYVAFCKNKNNCSVLIIYEIFKNAKTFNEIAGGEKDTYKWKAVYISHFDKENQRFWLMEYSYKLGRSELREIEKPFKMQARLQYNCYVDEVSLKRMLKTKDLNKHEMFINETIRSSTTLNISFDILQQTLRLLTKYPNIEKMYKGGFLKSAQTIIREKNYYKTFNLNGKTLPQMLKVKDMARVRMLREFDGDLSLFKINSEFEKNKKYLNPEQIKQISKKYSYGEIVKFLKIISMVQIHKYCEKKIKKQMEVACSHNWYDEKQIIRQILILWRDIIFQGKEAGLNINPDALLAKDLQAQHDRITELYNEKLMKEEVEKNRKNDLKLKKICEKLKRNTYQNDKFIVSHLESYEEFFKEGFVNGNCVASYYKRALENMCQVYKVRRLNDLETPFYTIEIRNGKMVQVEGKGRRKMTSEVEAFVSEWLEKVITKGKKKKVA
ncbi:MAG: PcfJ domain-containing protein [Anaerovoracaceae bacterium]